MDALLKPLTPELTADDLMTLAPYAKALGRARQQPRQKQMVGDHLSKKRGHGLELLELRPYYASDEVRHIDWRVTAKTGVAHTRVYVEEVEHHSFLYVTLTPDAYFGTRYTFISSRYAQLAALIAWRCQYRNEPLGVDMRSAHVTEQQPKLKNWPHFLSQLATMTRLNNRNAHSAMTIPPYPGKGCAIVILSDLLQLDDSTFTSLQQMSRHNRVYWVQIGDSNAFNLPQGQYTFFEGNTPKTRSVSRQNLASARQKYVFQLQTKRQTLAAMGVTLVEFDVADSPVVMASHLLHLGAIR